MKETKDPYELNQGDTKKLREDTAFGSGGVICPKRNKQINKPCKVCDKVAQLFSDNSKDKREIAYKKMAKLNWYCNIVLPSNPDKLLILEMGKKVGNQIIEGVEMKGWTDIAHPKKGKGRTMLITKSMADGRASYSASPSLKNVDWDIPDEIIKNLPNLDNEIIDIVTSKDERIYKISELKVGETLEFRMLPSWDIHGTRNFMKPLFRHWGGVTQAEVNGEVEMNMFTSDESKKADAESATVEEDEHPLTKTTTVDKSTKKEEKQPGCFGQSRYYDPDDKDCSSCSFMKKCAKTVAEE